MDMPRKNQKDKLGQNTIITMKNAFNGLISRLDMSKGISELEYMLVETSKVEI